ncbi:helix-turn-helix transcriptional regulator [Alkalibacter rhizosphaerae]|uniref:Helix-turn-helix transcriptional regulator n=1 Tax=Alkalibacter rhizosphaerae TaxID=2815577 RepID=A0A974XKJ9_9FIRM|nr:TetR/AcrR family transcriptional regulator [Alkalibacter rhizosphaerae]QSX07666.1 helix-turn-helix transcriptional regulator [Alkalibacter rhizosphaerae]
MGTYPAGEQTKEKLYEVAHEVFYEYGYHKASMKELSQRAGIKQSVFYYHYKNKSALAKQLYASFGKAHSSAIMEEILKKQYTNDAVTINCVCSALLLMNSVVNPQVGRFWAEMYTDNLTADIAFSRHFHELMYKKRMKKFDRNDFEFFLINSASINCALILAFLDNRLKVDPQQLARYKTENTLRLLDYSKDKMENITNDVLEIAKKIPIQVGEDFHIVLDGKTIF